MKEYIYHVAYMSDKSVNDAIMTVKSPLTTEKQFRGLVDILKSHKSSKNIVVLNLQLIEERELDKPLTNFERIKAMSVEELATLFDEIRACSTCRRNGNDCFPVSFNTEEWLKSEVKKE